VRRFAFAIVLLTFEIAFAQTDTLRAKVDSLFVRASSGQLKFRELNEPSKQALRGMPEAIPYLVEKLTIRDARERRTLIDILGKMPDAVMPVCSAALSSNKDVVKTACEILALLRDTVRAGHAAAPFLLEARRHPELQARGYAVFALGKWGGKGAREALLEALGDSVNLVRVQVAAALGHLKDTRTLPNLIQALDDEYYGVRFAAVNSLAKFDSTAVPQLLKSLNSETPMVRQLSAEALGKIRSRVAVPRLSRMLKSKLWSDRLAAIEALSQIDSPSARRILSLHREKETLVEARQKELLKK
jgi:HEAT repeat protein